MLQFGYSDMIHSPISWGTIFETYFFHVVVYSFYWSVLPWHPFANSWRGCFPEMWTSDSWLQHQIPVIMWCTFPVSNVTTFLEYLCTCSAPLINPYTKYVKRHVTTCIHSPTAYHTLHRSAGNNTDCCFLWHFCLPDEKKKPYFWIDSVDIRFHSLELFILVIQ